MPARTVTHLGIIGTPTGLLGPFDLTLTREGDGGSAWDLTGYSGATASAWRLTDRTVVATPGAVTIQTAASGIVRWTPVAANYTEPGTYEGRFYLTPSGGGDPQPSGLFRFVIAAGPA